MNDKSQAAPQQESVALDFSKPLETMRGEPVKHVCSDVIEYNCARVCVDQATGVVYSSPYRGLRIRNAASPPQAAQEASVCETCGGSRVDPGGLPICRDCGVAAQPQEVAPAVGADAKDAEDKIDIDREGARFWHRNCTNHFGGVMKEIKREPDKSLLECLHCGKCGHYPVGGVGRICAAIAAQSKKGGAT